MTRRLLSLLGFSAFGQVVSTTECRTPECGDAVLVISKPKRKPANGECPACGTMAPKRYDKWIVTDYGGLVFCVGRCPDGATCEYAKNIQVDCANCRNVFKMDAEAGDEAA